MSMSGVYYTIPSRKGIRLHSPFISFLMSTYKVEKGVLFKYNMLTWLRLHQYTSISNTNNKILNWLLQMMSNTIDDKKYKTESNKVSFLIWHLEILTDAIK